MGHLAVIDLNLLMLLWHSPEGSARARLLLIEPLEMLLFTHGVAGRVKDPHFKPSAWLQSGHTNAVKVISNHMLRT